MVVFGGHHARNGLCKASVRRHKLGKSATKGAQTFVFFSFFCVCFFCFLFLFLLVQITSESPVYPEEVKEKKLAGLLNGLLAKDARKRFGLDEMQKDEFFAGLSWSKLAARQVDPPASQ